ncbi:hypothetical protein [Pantoea eucrina]|uniref:hypothetical protein n=1 Tax=Pantoea eucrina TaxID=472693 RepID=UPI001CC80D30|nr:hypothetical protein [Pantoea eucrina]UBB12378.1 hypothetical protein LAC65_11130 [Pantoea eucrina]
MNKLTAEVARRDIGHLREHQASPKIGLSLREELYLQALEIALPMLEKQEKGNDGWIEWGGGRPPVKPDVMVCVRYRKGKEKEPDTAGHYYWNHTNSPVDIIAYQVIENDGREG